MKNVFRILENVPCYKIIASKYEGKIARRSGLSYMNHIREGAFILNFLYGDDEELIEAYCLHPVFQNDKMLTDILADDTLNTISPRVLLLAMEYRRVANSYTIKHKVREAEAIDIGPLHQVHKMLVADKIQNKKDFMKYMFSQHDRASYRRVAERTVCYFDSWLARLDVDEATYLRVTLQLEKMDFSISKT